ncbi:MAG TPA: glycosyl hydrolase, partial [Clostridia bacterium]|nr:glycosyl hydrolase [Clostridia bacterium]
ANDQTRSVLKFFDGLKDRKEKRVLSGQFTDFGNGSNLRIIEEIHDRTGHWVGMIGVDYADFPRGDVTYEAPNRTAIAYAKAGGIIHVMAHMYNPANPKKGGLRDKGVDLDELLKEGSDTHQRWMEQLDKIAAGLEQLQEAGVVAIWRPFHEMNGGWFWWGDKDPESFKRVWRHMFRYFTQTKKLNNLLWAYGPNHGKNTTAFYPGDEYVDIIGLDAYTDHIDPEHIRGYAELVKIKKPFGFTEYGPHGSSNPPGDYDYRRLMEGIKRHFPETVFFMSWNAKWSLARNLHVREMLEDPWVVGRER